MDSEKVLGEVESLREVGNGKTIKGEYVDSKRGTAGQESMMQRLLMQQEHYGGQLLEQISVLSSAQETAFQQLQESIQKMQLQPRLDIWENHTTNPYGHGPQHGPQHGDQQRVSLWENNTTNPYGHQHGEQQRSTMANGNGAQMATLPEADVDSEECDLALNAAWSSEERKSMEFPQKMVNNENLGYSEVMRGGTTLTIVPVESGILESKGVKSEVLRPNEEGWNKMKKHVMKPFEVSDRLGRKTIAQSEQEEEIRTKHGISCIRRVFKSVVFEPVCTIMLLTNALFIGVQVEYRAQVLEKNGPPAFDIVDYSYTAWFVTELLIRCSATGIRCFFTDPEDRSWNIFDTLIVLVSVIENITSAVAKDIDGGLLSNLSAIRAVRVCRVVRVARVIRVMRFFRSFRILTSALLSTAKSCLWTSVLLAILLYMFALVFAQGVADYRISIAPDVISYELEFYYGSLARGMFTLFKSICGGIDWEIAVAALSDVSALYVMLFVMMLVFVLLAVMNVMSGLFLQNALEQASTDKEDVIQEQLARRKEYVQKVIECFRELDDGDGDAGISLEEFELHLRDERMTGFLHSLEIETSDAWTLFKLLDVDGGGTVSISEFVDGMLRMRGNAKSVHLAQIMYENKWQMECLTELHKSVEHRFTHLEKKLKDLKPHTLQKQDHKHNHKPHASAPKHSVHGNSDDFVKPVESDFVLKPMRTSEPQAPPDMMLKPMRFSSSVQETTPLFPGTLVEEVL